jgi:predicted CopG family antitoxin
MQRIHMSTTIRISDDTKSRLSVLKEDDESWDEFLNRLARQERDADELGGFADADAVEDMEKAREGARGDWTGRIDSLLTRPRFQPE